MNNHKFCKSFFLMIISLSSLLSAYDKLPSVNELSIEQKVGQLLMVHFNGKNANAEAQKLIEEAHVGGFIYYNWANQLDNPYQVHLLSRSLQLLALKQPGGIPLLISADQEGGKVNRFTKGFTVFPGNCALGRTHQATLARSNAIATGRELTAVGVNMILSPVVDVNTSVMNPIIGIRSFSSDPAEVTHFARHALSGYHKVGMISVIKHFPGHGDTEIDSHDKLPIVRHSRKHLDKVELFPFNKLYPWADVIMTSHLLVTALDDENPVTISHKAVQKLLREQWKYEGVIMTDSLVMQGIMDRCSSIEEAAIRSIEAGHDIILLGGKQLLDNQTGYELVPDDIMRIHQALVDAVHSGRISIERLNASVKRILKLKEDYQLSRISDFIDIAYSVNAPEHQQLAKYIADESVCISSQRLTLPLTFVDQKVAVIAPESLIAQIELTTMLQLGSENRSLFIKGLNPTDAETLQASEVASWADIVIVCSLDSWKFEGQYNMITKLQNLNKNNVILIVGNPQDAVLYTSAGVAIWTFSPTNFSMQAAIDLLMKGIPVSN